MLTKLINKTACITSITTLSIVGYSQLTYAASIGLQDVYIFENFKNPSGLDITNDVVNTALSSSGTPISLPGEVTFIPTSAISGSVREFDTGNLRNDILVNIGVLQSSGNSVLTAIASLNLDQSPSTPIGYNILPSLDFSNVSSAALGTGAKLSYISMHTYSVDNESNTNPIQTFADRLNQGSFTFVSLKNDNSLTNDLNTLALVSGVPVDTVSGSTFWRYCGKALEVAGETIISGTTCAAAGAGAGALIGAGTGTVTLPGIGTVSGGVGGAIIGGAAGGVAGAGGGFLQGLGSAVKENNEPNPSKPVPEPLTLSATAIAGAFGLWMKYKQKRSHTV
ncbi:hypothetical protein A6770_38730 [Nostoc minutum NIES-26]|uniref:Uncharacterized protein n=1 Tax=Nostoc minutum NIES-26 TaxID=1844469 RepID=A0A367RSS8_9NOSO|nr:hypothetical protein A6770_38730 [Nostoc minutum NIES-26]